MRHFSLLTTLFDYFFHTQSSASSGSTTSTPVMCSADGAPPMTTVSPVTLRPNARNGRVLTFEQQGVTRYACFNTPPQAAGLGPDDERRWPLLIYLHGSRATPGSLYSLGHNLYEFHYDYALTADPRILGFFTLAPEGRRAIPVGASTGTGFHWDEWYRNPTQNLDALAVDHFLDEVLATAPIDRQRIYVFGWSNGAYMAALYGVWRSQRIAAIGQYAGADPWSREPCPVPLVAARQVPLVLLRNLCDQLVPCATTASWMQTLTTLQWPFAAYTLDTRGHPTAQTNCTGKCSRLKGLYCHIRWPDKVAFTHMLEFFKQHPLP